MCGSVDKRGDGGQHLIMSTLGESCCIYMVCCNRLQTSLLLLGLGLSLLQNYVPVHWASSDQSPQSSSPSHFHHVGIQRPFLHSYWKYLEQPGTSVGAAATHRANVNIRSVNVTVLPHFSKKSAEQNSVFYLLLLLFWVT